MVGLQAMVLGRLGKKTPPHPRACALSFPSPFAGRGPTGLRPLSCPWPRFVDLPLARPSLCVPSALREIPGSATMISLVLGYNTMAHTMEKHRLPIPEVPRRARRAGFYP